MKNRLAFWLSVDELRRYGAETGYKYHANFTD